MGSETKTTICGEDCHATTWNLDGANGKPIALAVIYHGFLAHGNFPTVRYAAEFLAEANYAVVAVDFPGHGKSSGLRGYVKSADSMIELGVEMAKFAKGLFPDNSDLPLFLVGSSMGGAIALSVSQRLGQESVAGVVLLAPMLKLGVSGLEHGLLGCLSYVLPTALLIPSSSTSSEKQARDPTKRAECDNDELSISGNNIRVGSALTCVDITVNLRKVFEKVTCPFLVLVADEDVVVKNEGSEELFAQSPSKDKTKKHYKAMHALMCEPSPLFDEIKTDILTWMSTRATK